MDTKQLQLENETLNARLDKAKEVFRQQAKDIKAKDEAYLKLRDEYNEVVRERDIHIEANAKFNKQILEAEELIKELKASQGKQQELGDAYNELKTKNDELTAEYNLLTAQFSDLENEYSNSEELRISYTEATNKLNEEVSRLQDIIVSKDAAYKNLESTYNDLAAEHIRDVNALKYTIEQLKTSIDKKDTDLKGLETLLLEKAETIKSLEDKLTAESGKVEEVKTKTEVAVTTIKKKLQALNDGLGDEFNIFG